MTHILVTGAAGQLGSRVVAEARRRAVPVHGATSNELDITDPAAVRGRLDDRTVLINCAAYTAVDRAEADVDAAFRVNEHGPRILARACAEAGARMIQLSTDYVFDGSADEPYETDAATAPRTVYGRSKLAGERAVHAVLPQACVVRTAWVYSGTGSDFVATMRRLESERDTVDVVDDQIGSPTYSADLAGALLELAELERPPSTVHYTNAGSASWFELARAVFEGIGADPRRVRPCSTAQFPRPAPRPAYSVLSGAVWTAAGLSRPRPWAEALRAALAESR